MFTLVCASLPKTHGAEPCASLPKTHSERIITCTVVVAAHFRKLRPLVANNINTVTLPPHIAHVDVQTLVDYVAQYDLTDTLVVDYPVMVLKLAYELNLERDDMMEMLIVHAISCMSSYKDFKDILKIVSRVTHEQEANMFELYEAATGLALAGKWVDEVLSVKHRDQLVRHVMRYAEAEDIVKFCDRLLRTITVKPKPRKDTVVSVSDAVTA